MIVSLEDGKRIEIEIILNFRLEELKKEYIAYTIKVDEDEFEDDVVYISEIDYLTKSLKSISKDEEKLVFELYEKARDLALED